MRYASHVRWMTGAALLLSLGAATAQAQERRPTRRIPVTKEQPAPDTVQQAPPDTTPPAPVDTTPPPPPPAPVDTTPPPPPAPIDTTPLPPPMPEGWRGGWYIGIAGGPTLPLSDTKDFFKTGWNVRVPIGWMSIDRPIGFRLDLGYDNLPNDEDVGDFPDLKAFNGTANLTVRLPFGETRRSAFYLIAGPGAYYLQDIPDEDTGDLNNETKFGANGGAGFEFGFGRRSAFFVEARYHRIFMPDTDIDILPVTAGFRF